MSITTIIVIRNNQQLNITKGFTGLISCHSHDSLMKSIIIVIILVFLIRTLKARKYTLICQS